MRHDLRQNVKAIDELISKTENPRHRAILQNYRTHALLELSGRYEEIFSPELTCPEPVYRTTEVGGTGVFTGAEEVREMYRRFVESGESVIVVEDEQLAVADWGFASEATHRQFVSGTSLLERGDVVEDPDSTYLLSRRVVMVWHYLGGKLTGEHVYEDATSRTITKVDPSEVVTPDEARRILAPLLAREEAMRE